MRKDFIIALAELKARPTAFFQYSRLRLFEAFISTTHEPAGATRDRLSLKRHDIGTKSHPAFDRQVDDRL